MSAGVLATLPTTSDRTAWTEDEAAVIEAAGLVFIHQYGDLKGQKVLAPRPIVAKFLHTCERTGLDPLARQIYCIGRFGRDGLEWSIQTAIDGFRVIAERSKQYAGQDDPEWMTDKGEWVPVFVKALHGPHPAAARIRVYRHDWPRPMTGIATWDEYVQTTSKGAVTSMWEQRGPGQLAKCAEALAFRKAFPQDLSGIYTDDEMDADASQFGEREPADEEAAKPPHLRSRVAQLTVADPDATGDDYEGEIVDTSDGPSEVIVVDEVTDTPAGDSVAPAGRTGPRGRATVLVEPVVPGEGDPLGYTDEELAEFERLANEGESNG